MNKERDLFCKHFTTQNTQHLYIPVFNSFFIYLNEIKIIISIVGSINSSINSSRSSSSGGSSSSSIAALAEAAATTTTVTVAASAKWSEALSTKIYYNVHKIVKSPLYTCGKVEDAYRHFFSCTKYAKA